MREEFIKRMHQEEKRNAFRLQRTMQQGHIDAGQPMDKTNYVIRVPEFAKTDGTFDVVPARHDRVVYGPQHRQKVMLGIETVTVRYPVVERDDDDAETEAPYWNDIFIEVAYEDPEDTRNKRYLLNGKGMTPYVDAEDIDFESDPNTNDIFTVVPRHEMSPTSIDVSLVMHLISEDVETKYVYQHQDNSQA